MFVAGEIELYALEHEVEEERKQKRGVTLADEAVTGTGMTVDRIDVGEIIALAMLLVGPVAWVASIVFSVVDVVVALGELIA